MKTCAQCHYSMEDYEPKCPRCGALPRPADQLISSTQLETPYRQSPAERRLAKGPLSARNFAILSLVAFVLGGILFGLSRSVVIQRREKNHREVQQRMLLLNQIFLSDFDNPTAYTLPSLPDSATMKLVLGGRLPAWQRFNRSGDWTDRIFTDPASGQDFVPNPSLAGLNYYDIANPAQVISFYAPEPDGDERIVGYVEGFYDWVPEAQWPARKAAGYFGVPVPLKPTSWKASHHSNLP